MRYRIAAALAGVSLTLGVAAVPTTTLAQTAGDPEAGRTIAHRWCSSCHVVDVGGHGTDAAPAFFEIARRHHGDRRWVRAWLSAPHPRMANLSLSRIEIDDIIAYLRSIATR